MSEDFKDLLAKSVPKDAISEQEDGYLPKAVSASFTGHIGAVYQSARVLLAEIGDRIFQQLGLKESDRQRFEQTVKLAAYLHDWGKANQHFQEMVCRNSAYPKKLKDAQALQELISLHQRVNKSWRYHGQRQMIRHEVLSGILALQVPEFREWLSKMPDIKPDDLIIAVWAAMGHHLKLDTNKIDGFPNGTGVKIRVYTSHPDFELVTKKMGVKFLKLPANSVPTVPTRDWSREELEEAINGLIQEFGELSDRDEYEQRFIAAVKAMTIAADLAGSALTEEGENIKTWIPEMLKLVLEPKDLAKVLEEKLKGKKLRQFQQEIAETKQRVTLVKAGCGTGKTIAAYAWAQKWAVQTPTQDARKLFFCYPTTGTATQGFIDYANGTETESLLMHSRSDLDQELLFSGDEDNSEGVEARLAGLQTWTKKIVVCTVDTVLGLMQNNRRPLYAFPALMQAAFVFDEVHAYDDRLFGALLKFIKTFRGAPILLMSASFSEEQKEAIRQVVENDLGEEINILDRGYKPLEEIPRYRFDYHPEINSKIESLQPVFDVVIQSLEQGEKVLWVTNSVQSCIDIYRKAKEYIDKSDNPKIILFIYHSRFRYFDRVEKHKQVIAAFDKENKAPCLAITTQVCEMSLDLSADLLVSPMAPAAALIQRLGRLNRQVEEYAPEKFRVEQVCTAIIYAWDGLPYNNEEMRTGIQLVEGLQENQSITQENLADVAAEIALPISTEEIKSMWLDGDLETYSVSLREGGGTITVLLEQDIQEIKNNAKFKTENYIEKHAENYRNLSPKELNQAKKREAGKFFMREAKGWSVPIRFSPSYLQWDKHKYYFIAPANEITYDPEVGAEPWKKT